MKRLPYRWLGLGALALLAAACAQPNGDINRVQPNVTKKADLLDGEWYIRNTVTWAPATTGFTFAGETGKLEKIVWEIQEGNLVGYRSYPYIPGQEGRVEDASRPSGTTARYCDGEGKCVGGHKYYGAPIVAYPIRSQFDIQRNYNPATGETGNIIQENATDRPWNEREYIRVDWSASWINQGKEMMWNTVQNPAGGTNFNAFIQANEPGTDPYDWPVQEFKKDGNGEEKLTYFDFTGRYFAKPSTYYFEGFGDVPMCYLWGGHRYDCTAAEIRMRTSLAKVDPKKVNDYEPLVYDNAAMKKFGYFRTERLTYDRQFGVTEQGVIYLANRFNLWKETFEKDASGAPDQSRPIPMNLRAPKPIVYYSTPANRMGGEGNYIQYLEASRVLAKNWDVAFKRAVAAAQGKGNDTSSVPQMVYLCPNPVPANDPLDGTAYDANHPCGAPGTAPKFGDLRYSFMYTIVDPTPNGLLGYGPSSPDPETGELISANANTYTGAVDSVAQSALDVIDTLVGEKTIDVLISGEDVRAYFAALENKSYAHLENNLGKNQNQLVALAEDQFPVRSNEESKGSFQRPTPYLASKFQMLAAQGGFSTATTDRMAVAADMLKQHPSLESAILDNPEMKQDALTMLPPALAERAMADPQVERNALRQVMLNYPAWAKHEQRRIDFASRNNMYLAEFLDRPMFSLAKREAEKRAARVIALRAEGKSAYDARVIADNEVRRRLQQAVWRATSEHEIGHTFGLRHNFQASFDAINYFDDYWRVKRPFLTVDQNGTKVVARTPNDLRLLSDASGAYGVVEANANSAKKFESIYDYEYSSIMDYGGKINADMAGIGKYDEAAIIFAYSGGREPGYVEVFNQARKGAVQELGSDGKQVTLTGAAYDLPIVNAQHKSQAIPNYQERFHYTTFPLRFGEGATIDARIDSGIARFKTQNRSLKKWSDVKAAHERMATILKAKPNPTEADIPSDIPLEVPYMFCTDDHVGYVLSCNRFDRGPDYFEMTRQWLEDYWNGYYFDHFRRDRYAFSDNRAVNSAFNAFYSAASVYKFWVRQSYTANVNSNSQQLEKYTLDQNMQDTWSMAAFDGINNLLDVMSVPQAGYHGLIPANEAYGCTDCWANINEGDEFRNLDALGRANTESYFGHPQIYNVSKFGHMPRGVGRATYSRYDFRSGFGFWDRLVEVGHYNDQFAAMFAAVLPEVYFLDADDVADARRYTVPYYLVFNKELAEVFGATWSNDEAYRRPTAYIKTPAVNCDQTTRVCEKPAILDVAYRRNITPENYVSWGANGSGVPFRYVTTKESFTAAESAKPVNVQTTWTARIYSIFLGMALFSVNYDLDYSKANQVYKVGAGEGIPASLIPANYSTTCVDDLLSGHRYCAVHPITVWLPSSTISMDEMVAYGVGEKVIRNGNIYVCTQEGFAGQTGPSGTGTNITDGTVRWDYVSAVPAGVVAAPRHTPAGRMVKEALRDLQRYKAAPSPNFNGDKKFWEEVLRDDIRDLDMMRGMYAVYGKAF